MNTVRTAAGAEEEAEGGWARRRYYSREDREGAGGEGRGSGRRCVFSDDKC
jgi:hypothetical protein